MLQRARTSVSSRVLRKPDWVAARVIVFWRLSVMLRGSVGLGRREHTSLKGVLQRARTSVSSSVLRKPVGPAFSQEKVMTRAEAPSQRTPRTTSRCAPAQVKGFRV